MIQFSFSKVCLATMASASFALAAQATVSPFTETFDADGANFLDTGFAAVDHDAAGFISVTVPDDATASMGLVVLRAELDPRTPANSASGGAFAGDYIEEGITQLSVDVRHDADFDIDVTARFSPAARFPGSFPLVGGTVGSGSEFTTLTFDIGSLSDVSFEGAPTPENFEAVFGDVANIQLFLGTDISGQEVTFDFDNFAIAVPEPTSMALFVGMGGVMMRRRRRARG